jgi:uncharacterized protein YfaQ (DUF2300 family)
VNRQARQAHAPPQAQPAEASEPIEPVAATNEKRRRTRSLPHDGHASAVSTEAVIDRRSSKRRSHAKQTYS